MHGASLRGVYLPVVFPSAVFPDELLAGMEGLASVFRESCTSVLVLLAAPVARVGLFASVAFGMQQR